MFKGLKPLITSAKAKAATTTSRPFASTSSACAAKAKAKSKSSSSSSSSSSSPPPPNPGSRQKPPKRHNPHGDSYILAGKVKRLTDLNGYQNAIDLVKTSPSANIVVWNVLLTEILKATVRQGKNLKRAFDVWTDMKRRRVRPSPRSFAVIFSGSDWIKKEDTVLFGKLKSIYADWLVYAENSIKGTGTHWEISGVGEDEEISAVPANAYLACLNRMRRYDEVLETFNELPTEGPLAPDATTYSTVLSAARSALLAQQTFTPSSTSDTPAPPHLFPKILEIFSRLRQEPWPIETRLTSLMISICRDAATLDDQKIGLDLAQKFYGLVVDPLKEHELVSGKLPPPPVQMDAIALSNVLTLALKINQSNLAVRLFDQVRDYPERFGYGLLSYHHCDLVLIAHGNRNNVDDTMDLIQWMIKGHFGTSAPDSPIVYKTPIPPQLSTWTNAIQACWRSSDLPRALELYSLMTGRPHSPSPSPISPSTELKPPPLSHRFHKEPDERIASTLLQTALATKDRGKIHSILQLLESDTPFGPQFFTTLPRSSSLHPSATSSSSVSSDKDTSIDYAPHWRYKLSEVIEQSIDRLLEAKTSVMTTERKRELVRWKDSAVDWRSDNRDSEPEVGESMEMRRKMLSWKKVSKKFGEGEREESSRLTGNADTRGRSGATRDSREGGNNRRPTFKPRFNEDRPAFEPRFNEDRPAFKPRFNEDHRFPAREDQDSRRTSNNFSRPSNNRFERRSEDRYDGPSKPWTDRRREDSGPPRERSNWSERERPAYNSDERTRKPTYTRE